MNKELKFEYNELRKKYYELNKIYSMLERCINRCTKGYRKEESIKAAIKIKDYYQNIKNECEELNEKLKSMHKELQETCNHEISINFENRRTCALCGCNLFREEDYHPIYEIEVPFNSHSIGMETAMDNGEEYVEDFIERMIDEYLKDENTLEDNLEYLQYNSKALVRRLK